jgi:acyl dehydratase
VSLDRSAVGRELPRTSLLITRSRLRAFAKSTGQQDRIYTDVDAARQAGHRDLPVPPTFFYSVDLESANPAAYLEDLGVDLRTSLHGEQEFTYHQMAYAGDELTSTCRITDIYEKKGGLLEFIVRESTVTNQDGVKVATMRNTVAVQHHREKDLS